MKTEYAIPTIVIIANDGAIVEILLNHLLSENDRV